MLWFERFSCVSRYTATTTVPLRRPYSADVETVARHETAARYEIKNLRVVEEGGAVGVQSLGRHRCSAFLTNDDCGIQW